MWVFFCLLLKGSLFVVNWIQPCLTVRRTEILIALFSILLFGLVVLSASLGYMKIEFSEVLKIILAQLPGQGHMVGSISEASQVIVMDVRLPRILTCAAVGGGLALSGVIFQGILLNPLADPYTLGVSAGAAFGACFAILLNLGAAFVSVPLFAFAGACLTLFFVIFLSYSGKNSAAVLSSNSLILSGIIVAAILSAGISFLKYTADEQVSIIIFWLMGSFASKTWLDVGVTFLCLVLGLVISMVFARDLNLISLGERSAASLGVDTRKVTLVLLVTGSMLAAVSVSVSGIIGFVGLLVPHMVRLFTGPDNRRLIPVSLLAGALLLLGADTITRAILPHEIPIGILTALIGGPVFCWIFKRGAIR